MENGRRFGLFVVVLGFVAACFCPVGADIVEVGKGGEFTYHTIQEGITAANPGDTVVVWPGRYVEEVDFTNKPITLTSGADAAIIDGDGGFGVSFTDGQDANSVLEHFVITNCNVGIICHNSSPAIRFVTVAGNSYGVQCTGGSDPSITSSIFWDNSGGDILGGLARYSCIENEEPVNSLVSYWPFDGDANDVVGDNDGAVYGAAVADGVFGQGYYFDGVGDYVLVDSPSHDFDEDTTISMWVKLDAESTDHYLFDTRDVGLTGDSISALIDTGSDYLEVWGGGAKVFDFSAELDTWYHIAIVHKDAENDVEAYVNGEPLSVAFGIFSDFTYGNDDLLIGSRADNFESFHGTIDEVALYNRILLPIEIEHVYNHGLGSTGGSDNISEDPLFGDQASGDYHPKSRIGRFQPVCLSEQCWSEPVLLAELNGDDGYEARAPCLSRDGLTMYFDRKISGVSADPGHIVEAYRDTPEGPFTTERIVNEIFVENYQANPWISDDELRLYYNEGDPVGGARIKMAERATTGDPWVHVRTFDELHEYGYVDIDATLTADDLVIVFDSPFRPGSTGGHDLFMASRTSTEEPFGNIRELSEINTTENESGPSLLPDGLTLYFNSTNRDEHTGSNVFKATRSSLIEPFGNVQLISYPDYSTMKGEVGCYVTADEKYLYFRDEILQGIWLTEYMSSGEGEWVQDGQSSPCIDGGDPMVNPMIEPMPNGARANMGAFGATAYAGMSEAEWPNPYDFNMDGIVNVEDFAIFCGQYMWMAPWME